MLPVDDLLAELEGRLIVISGGRDAAPDVAAMIARIKRARFSSTRGRGYDPREVDTFLDQAVEALAQGYRPGAAPAFTVRRRGYERADVDAFTDELRGAGGRWRAEEWH